MFAFQLNTSPDACLPFCLSAFHLYQYSEQAMPGYTPFPIPIPDTLGHRTFLQ